MKTTILGGSVASGNHHPDSDIDSGLYYSEDARLEIHAVRAIAYELNDFANPAVTDLGE